MSVSMPRKDNENSTWNRTTTHYTSPKMGKTSHKSRKTLILLGEKQKTLWKDKGFVSNRSFVNRDNKKSEKKLIRT